MRLADVASGRLNLSNFVGRKLLEWGGVAWWRGRDGYYMDNDRRKLHRAIYERVYGPIPKKWHIDHVDGDKENNHFCNLRALSPSEHARKTHTGRPSSERQKLMLAKRSAQWWSDQSAAECVCSQCGGGFLSRAVKPRMHCSKACLEKWRRDGKFSAGQRKCDCCGETYHARVKHQRFCSKACNSKINNYSSMAAKPTREVFCSCCGVAFETKRGNAKFCGRACAVRAHSTAIMRGSRKIRDYRPSL